MDIKIERFHLRKIIPEFRELNSAVVRDRENLQPWFWWANVSRRKLFQILFVNLCVEKLAMVLSDLPYNHKFIIRSDGKFAGVIGIDRLCKNAAHPEVWFFITNEYRGTGVATRALELAEKYAHKKHAIEKIYARTAPGNARSEKFLRAHGYNVQNVIYDLADEYFPREHADMTHWVKQIKTVEK